MISITRGKLYNYLNFVIILLFSKFNFSQVTFPQNPTKVIVGVNPTISNAALKTDLFSVNKVEIPLIEKSSDTLYRPILIPLRPKLRSESYYVNNYNAIKNEIKLNYSDEDIKPSQPVNTSISLLFGKDVNKGDMSAPLDNTIAVSFDNFIIAVSNNIIEFYDNNNSLVFRTDLQSFVNKELPRPCDPRVIFDPEANRFILFLQRCDEDIKNTEILVAFSKTPNPLDGWNFYKLTGNPLKENGRWFDYPNIALSNEDLFISGNIFNIDKFDQSVVYQINKNNGYSGNSLDFRVWYDFKENPFTLKPVGHSHGNSPGSGIYLLSTTWNISGSNSNTIKLFDITSDLYDDSARVDFFRVNVKPYNFFGNAIQINKKIDNGDIRMQDALLHKNFLYYVFTSGNENNFSRINFNILDLTNLSNRNILLGGERNTSYAYPSLHFLSLVNEEPNILIQFNSTSKKSYPDIRALNCNDKLICNREQVLKTGESTIEIYDRWGDYTSIAKNYQTSNELLIISSYGKSSVRQSFLGKVVTSDYVKDDLNTIYSDNLESIVNLDFDLKKERDIEVFLKRNGTPLKIYEGLGEKGGNKFQITTNNLQQGNYILEILRKNSSKSLGEISFKIAE